MVRVTSSTGALVNVEIKGVAEALRVIRAKGKDILDGKDTKVFQAANFLQGEIQESIIGNRAEPRSVATGNFANSITVIKVKDLKYKIITAVEYAKFLEYGSIYISPRNHFRNSLNRNKDQIIKIIKGIV